MSPCIEWTGYRLNGYAAFKRKGKMYRVSRVVWEVENGPVPDGMLVCHHCDNPACYNIEHLFLGTPTDNMRDMVSKGRHCGQKRTQCPRGHPLAGDNLVRGRLAVGHRRCRECANRAIRECRARRKAMAA